MKHFHSWLYLFWLFFQVKWFHYQDKRQMRKAFPGFIPYDTVFERNYLWHNPFRIFKAFSKEKQGSPLDAYGETPFSVLARVAKECPLTPKDRVLELGCGRGKGVFFWSHLASCPVVGIDWVPFFIQRAHRIAEQLKPRLQVEFYCQDMLETDFSGFTVIYLYGTCLEDSVIEQLISRFENLDREVKIVTVSYPLSDYSLRFYTANSWTASFPWGEAELYINLQKSLHLSQENGVGEERVSARDLN